MSLFKYYLPVGLTVETNVRMYWPAFKEKTAKEKEESK